MNLPTLCHQAPRTAARVSSTSDPGASQLADFTSSLYLGMTHASKELPGWRALTDGRPAILRRSTLATFVGAQVATMQGLPSGIVARSTLHGLFDLVPTLTTGEDVVLAIDRLAYPIIHLAARVERANVPTVAFRHHSPEDLAARLRALGAARAIVLTDGFCATCCRAAPLHRYLSCCPSTHVQLLVDDTQGFGLLGGRGAEMTSRWG